MTRPIPLPLELFVHEDLGMEFIRHQGQGVEAVVALGCSCHALLSKYRRLLTHLRCVRQKAQLLCEGDARLGLLGALATLGNLDLVAWAHRRGMRATMFALALAAEYGQLYVLWNLWMGKYGVFDIRSPYGVRPTRVAVVESINAMAVGAAKGGKVDVLTWLWKWTESFSYRTNLSYRHSNAVIAQMQTHAAERGHVGVLQYLLSKGCVMCRRAISDAARCGQLHVLRWAHEANHKMWGGLYGKAVEGGHYDILNWLLSIGVECSPYEIIESVSGGA